MADSCCRFWMFWTIIRVIAAAALERHVDSIAVRVIVRDSWEHPLLGVEDWRANG